MRKYTAEDIEYIKDKWGILTVNSIAKKLKRKPSAILQKAYKLGLPDFMSSCEYISLKSLLKAVGYNPSERTYKRLSDAGLNIKIIKLNSKRYRVVLIDDFWRWLFYNRDKLNISKMDKNALGKEPIWVDEKRKYDSKNPTKKNKRGWTTEQESLLKAKVKSGRYTYDELASEFKRTVGAIRRKCWEMDIKVTYDKKAFKRYTPEEEKVLIEMYNNKIDAYNIALEIGREEISVRGKISYLRQKKIIA